MIAFLRTPRSLARLVLCGAALLVLVGAVVATRDRPAAPVSMATEGSGDASSAGSGAPAEHSASSPDDEAPADQQAAGARTSPGTPVSTRASSDGSTTTTGPRGSASTTTTTAGSVAADEDIGPLVGRVHDEANRPIPDICISAVDPRTGRTETLARTDAEGRYRAEGLRTDTISLRMCDPADHDFGWLASTLGPGIDVSNGREANGDMQLVSLGALRGRVVDLAGRPVAGACVAPWLQPWARVSTDAEGRFTARHVIVGHYYDDLDSARLFASCSGGRQLTMKFGDFYVRPGEWTEVVITTDPDGPSPPPPGPGCCIGSGPTI